MALLLWHVQDIRACWSWIQECLPRRHQAKPSHLRMKGPRHSINWLLRTSAHHNRCRTAQGVRIDCGGHARHHGLCTFECCQGRHTCQLLHASRLREVRQRDGQLWLTALEPSRSPICWRAVSSPRMISSRYCCPPIDRMPCRLRLSLFDSLPIQCLN